MNSKLGKKKNEGRLPQQVKGQENKVESFLMSPNKILGKMAIAFRVITEANL